MLGFVGPFGDSNYGDYAMFVNDVYTLDIRSLMVFTYNGELMQELEQTYLRGYDIHTCVVDVDYAYEEQLTGRYHTEYDIRPDTPLEILKRIQNPDEIRCKMEQIHTLVVCGGGYFNHVWNAKHRKQRLFSILAPILTANAMHKKIVFMGNTYGPFDGSAEMFSNFFNSLDNVIMASRDDLYSISNLKKLGFDREVQLIPDDLYFLSPQLLTKTPNINLPEKYILIEFYPSMDEVEEHLSEIRDFVRSVKEQYNMNTVFLPLGSNWGGQYQGQLIRENIADIFMVSETEDFLSIEILNTIVKRAEFVVCQRYHLFLTAIANNIPCVQALKEVCGDMRYYYCKAKGLLNQVFANQMIQEEIFLSLNLWEGLKKVQAGCQEIAGRQREHFNQKKEDAEEEMKKKRECFLKNIC